MTLFMNLLNMLSWTVSYSNQGLEKKLNDSLTIQYIDLRVNPLLFSEVKKYVEEQHDSCQLFRDGFGFVTVGNVKLVRNGSPIDAASLGNHLKDIEVEFNIGLSSFYPHQNLGLPLYYSFVTDRLVLVYDQNVKWLHRNAYSASSQHMIKALISRTLEAVLKEDFVFKGISGEAFTLTVEQRKQMNSERLLEMGSWSLSKLKTVVQHFDGSISYRYIPLGKVR